MNGTVAQIVALTCHGNAFLHGRPVGRFFPDNSTCLFCDEIVFSELNPGMPGEQKEEIVASSPDRWFELLQKQGTTGVQIFFEPNKDKDFPERIPLASFMSGGTWAIEAVDFRGRSHYWLSRREVLKKKGLDDNIWKSIFFMVPEKTPGETRVASLESVSERLRESLTSISVFAQAHNCEGFFDLFNKALDALIADNVTWVGYHRDLAPPGMLSRVAIRILDACQIAWVFNRAGPWSNLKFEGEDEIEYRRVSGALFGAIVDGILASVNESY
jgi:hypothetical protein